MGKFVNWLICGDIDGLDHKEKEEFRQKFPYQTIRGVLGGEDATNVLAANAKLSTYPKGLTSEQAKLMADLQAAAAATRIARSRSTHGGDWTWQLVNKLTGYPEHVDIKLDVPDVSFPDIDIPPVPANRIRPIRDLVNRFIPNWYNRNGKDGKCKPEGKDFAKAIARSLYGKTFNFNVSGIEQTPVNAFFKKCVLCVHSYDINDHIVLKLKEFKEELDAIKTAYRSQKATDEAIIRQGAVLSGRIDVADCDCSQVELDDVKVYTVKVRGGDKLTFVTESIANEARQIREFTVDSIDRENLVVVVSSPQTEKLIEMQCAEDEAIKRSAAMPRPKTDILEGKPVLIDGNNVVLYSKEEGWRVLKTLVDWLKRNSVDYYVYFDASIDYKEMNAKGWEFISKLKADGKCPARDEADNFILWDAHNTGSHVISNDQYRQWDEEYPWIDTKNHTGDVRRIHKFHVKEDNILSVPDLGIWVKIGGV